MNDNLLTNLYMDNRENAQTSKVYGPMLSRVDLVKHNNQSIHNVADFNLYKPKLEHCNQVPMEANINSINTKMMSEGDIKETYTTSSYQTNVNPNDLQYVGPGINKGFVNNPTGGFNQGINVIPYILPKTVDELRTVNNPKIVNEGRILMGAAISKIGLEGDVVQYKPDTYYINEMGRWLTTTGAIKKERIKPKMIIKDTNRIVSMELKGNIHNRHLVKSTVKAEVALSRKNLYKETNIGPANPTTKKVNDYGRTGYRNVPNMRQTTESKTNELNVQSLTKKNTVYDPNDVARTTIKETNIHNNTSGFINGVTKKPRVYDPDDVARTTIKETNIYNNTTGNMQVVGPGKMTTYDPSDVPRTTVKETTIDNKYTGIVNKENTNGGYMTNEHEARNTNRQFSHKPYIGTGNSSYKKEMINKHSSMRLNEGRESTLVSRQPTTEGSKVPNTEVNIQIKKVECDYINQRQTQKTRVQTLPLYRNAENYTSAKPQLNDHELMIDRINPYVISSLKTNPYVI